MKKATQFLFILISLLMLSCNNSSDLDLYLITTTVDIKDGETEKVLNLFKATNFELVKGQRDWVKATFSANEEKSTVMVQAYWKNKDSYLKFRTSEEFQTTMGQFDKHFKGKPKVEITKILFEM